jgi:DNA topoisomerase-1
MGKPLVIVESPAKARTIRGFLGDAYRVEACVGHIRDLPEKGSDIPAAFKKQAWARIAVDVDNDYKPLYVLTTRGKEQVKMLKGLLADAPALYLATDEDREGEAIAWHLVEALSPKVPIYRLAFHEITKQAILAALDAPRQVDMQMVQAQETRRIIDRLFGYNVSPLLWRKVKPKLSAGRVQSVAVRLVVERERERMAFRKAQWWDLAATMQAEDGSFASALVEVDGTRVAVGRDFDPTTGKLKKEGELVHLFQEAAEALLAELEGLPAVVSRMEETDFTERPYPAFTTSTLQQEANRRFRWTGKRTMSVAQRLYEAGWITYMRTDSTALSTEALDAARAYISQEFGTEYLPEKPRFYKTKSQSAQEAHEAIRPAGQHLRSVGECAQSMEKDQVRLYELIFKRTLACQMVDARGSRTVLDTTVGKALFRASGKVYRFAGYRAAYVQTLESNAVKLGRGETDGELPAVEEGQSLNVETLSARPHTTQPVARLTEATLVKEMEARGIGRPSTYASIIGTIQDRGYVFKRGTALVPTWTAIAVTRLMEQHFSDLVDYNFTAQLESGLDAIARGERASLDYLNRFYRGQENGDAGDSGLVSLLALAEEKADPRQVCSIPLGVSDGEDVLARVGRWGPYLEHGERRGRIPEDLAPDELGLEKALELLSKEEEGPHVLGQDAKTGLDVTVRDGRFGPYVQLGEIENKGDKPPRCSLLKGMTPESMTLETALKLLALPMDLGPGTDGNPVLALNGRYGPYVKCGDETRNIPQDIFLLEITLAQALELLSQPSKRGQRGSPKALSELGSDGEGRTIKLMNGRYGPYVTDGDVNASLPKGTEADGFSLEAAIALLEKKRQNPPPKRKGRRRS